MKILFLDDASIRHDLAADWFNARYPVGNGPPHEITHVWSAAECIGAYVLHQSFREPFALVSLDHDLGDEDWWDGRSVVRGLLYLGPSFHYPNSVYPPAIFEIHSWNGPAAGVMHEDLHRAGFTVTRLPFQPKAYTDKLKEDGV